VITVQFVNVGREHKTWVAELPDCSEWTIAKEAAKALLSRDVHAEHGTIYAGFRAVGRYRILSAQSSTSA
jgi:hypothetical protein